MSDLIFRYGVMGSLKSTSLIKEEKTLREAGKKTFIIKPCLDDREGANVGFGKLQSRLIESDNKAFYTNTINDSLIDSLTVDIVFVDEVQFFKKSDILNLAKLVDNKDITVICYGLKTDSNQQLFEGSATLLAIADKLEELPADCKCGRRASMHLRYVDDVLAENQGGVAIEKGKVTYQSVCRKCWHQAMLNKMERPRE